MKTSDLVTVGAIALGAWWIYRQSTPTAAGTFTWSLPYQQPVAVSDGALLPSFTPGVSEAGRVVPGGNAPWVTRIIAPDLWMLGGSPSGYNPAGALEYDLIAYPPSI